MTKKSQNLVFALCLLLLKFVIFANATGIYSVIGPGTIHSNHKYNVVVSIHEAEGPCSVKVGITGPSYNETKTIEIQPKTTQNVEFDVPKLQSGDYNLTAVGLSGITFENTTNLNMAEIKPFTFIQTDKATYKPSDLVQFRVLVLDENSRPAKISEPVEILVMDGAKNRIKQLSDVKLNKGVYSGEFQLSEQPVLGEWSIEVVLGSEHRQVKSFDVDKYVLPKFEVTIDTAKDVALADGIIKATIRAKYTYGKPVKGKATVSIKPGVSYFADSSVKSEKTIDVDGKGHVEFDISKDLNIAKEQLYLPSVKILAVMEEALTGYKQNGTATVNLARERYRIEGIDTPHSFQPGKKLTFKVVIKNLDGSPVQDTKNPVKLVLDTSRSYFYRLVTVAPTGNVLEFESKLNEHGMATFEVDIPNTNDTQYSVKCLFLDTTSYLSTISLETSAPTETLEKFEIIVNTKTPRIGKDISIRVNLVERTPYFVYTIVGRGNILKSEYVSVPENRDYHVFKLTPTFEMVPTLKMFVHFVHNGDLYFEEKSISLEKDFENSIDITTVQQAKPGDDVKINVKTDPESFVGLLGVDQSVLLLKSGNDISKNDVFNSLEQIDTNTPWIWGYGRYPGQTSGLVTLTNANYPYNTELPIIYFSQSLAPALYGVPGVAMAQQVPNGGTAFGAAFPAARVEPPRTRKEFPENWIFQDIQNSADNEFSLAKKIPDTITSWVITGFSLNPKTGFALTENPTKIQVFQPFFVSTNLPYSVKRGEVIAIPIVLFNYMDKALDAEVTMDNTDKEYDFTEATNEVDESSIDEVKRVKRVSIPSNTGKSLSFMIRPNKVGQITLKITAVTPLAGDAVHQTLKVEAEGVTQYENRAIFINLKDKNEYTESIKVDIPAEAVPDSEYIEFSVVGDLLGPTIKNLDKLVRMPYGCGEQNMVNFVPNILVLKYLDATKQSMPAITEKAKKFMEIGYQRELTYKHDDGSYSAFGKSDKAGSTWLTAYVVRSFHQAIKYTDIDPKVLEQGLDFLASQQAEDGKFPEHGKLFDSAHQNELGLTSFVLLAFLENVEYIPKYQTQIDKGIKYVLDNIDKSDDRYSLSIAALALQLSKHPSAEKLLAKLQSLANQENEFKWWSQKPSSTPPEQKLFWHPQSNDVEITSYVLLAMLDSEPAESALPIIKWLISKRNDNGGFSSTQDTVMGLQALIKFAEKTGSGSGEIDIDFVSSGGAKNQGSLKVSPDNALVLQSHVLDKSTRQLDFTAKGKGSCMVQLAYRYNLAEKEKQPSFKVQATVSDSSPKLNVDICTEFVPLDDVNKDKDSNMAVLEVALPSGYTAEADDFDKIQAVDRVKRVETKNSDSTVIVYFDGLSPGKTVCVPIEGAKTHAVAKQKPAAITVYDYYNTDRHATEYYEVKSSLCDICEGEDCGSGCKKE